MPERVVQPNVVLWQVTSALVRHFMRWIGQRGQQGAFGVGEHDRAGAG